MLRDASGAVGCRVMLMDAVGCGGMRRRATEGYMGGYMGDAVGCCGMPMGCGGMLQRDTVECRGMCEDALGFASGFLSDAA